MMQLSKRIRFEMLIVGCLMLGSCNYHSPAETYDLAQVANANAANALNKCSDLEDRLSDVESRLNM